MEILKETKNKDGSVNLECDCLQEELDLLASVGMNKILREFIESKKPVEAKKQDTLQRFKFAIIIENEDGTIASKKYIEEAWSFIDKPKEIKPKSEVTKEISRIISEQTRFCITDEFVKDLLLNINQEKEGGV